MVRLCLLGCVVLLAACGEKAPEEGALRVSVKYGSFKPKCVRVEVQDAHGHTGATDVPASQFQNSETQEVLVAVLRKAEWDRELSVTVSSLASAANGRCDGAVLERFASQPIPIPPKAFARHDVTLVAVDGDGDGAPVNVPWAEGSDCHDDDPRFHPGAEEACTGTDGVGGVVGITGIVIVDDDWFDGRQRQRLLDHAGEFAVDDQQPGFGMVELEGDDRRIEPGVERMQHAPGHRYGEMRLQHRRGVGQHHRHRVALADAVFGQCRGELQRALPPLAVVRALVAVDDGDMVGEGLGGAFEKTQRRQRLVVGGILVEVFLICFGHRFLPVPLT